MCCIGNCRNCCRWMQRWGYEPGNYSGLLHPAKSFTDKGSSILIIVVFNCRFNNVADGERKTLSQMTNLNKRSRIRLTIILLFALNAVKNLKSHILAGLYYVWSLNCTKALP